MRSYRSMRAVLWLWPLLLALVACDKDPSRPRYTLETTPSALEIEIGREAESPVELVSTVGGSNSSTLMNAALRFFSSDVTIVTMRDRGFAPVGESFRGYPVGNKMLEVVDSVAVPIFTCPDGAKCYDPMAPDGSLDPDRAQLYVTCHRPGKATIEIQGVLEFREFDTIIDDGNTVLGVVNTHATLDATTSFEVTCIPPVSCGDGIVDPYEECDDGNTDDGDGCSAVCREEGNCGDGVVDSGEECDDGNTDDGDGCDSECLREGEAECGDGILDVGEECDDGNTDDGDGCDSECMSEQECGNDVLEGDEECDDGNRDDGDGCDSECYLEGECGDEVVQAELGEECDDGNIDPGDGCDENCLLEEDYCEPTTGHDDFVSLPDLTPLELANRTLGSDGSATCTAAEETDACRVGAGVVSEEEIDWGADRVKFQIHFKDEGDGDHVVITVVLADEIPLDDATEHYQYGFVFDRDGDPANNYVAHPSYPSDFFVGTDRWYQFTHTPGDGWSFSAQDIVSGSPVDIASRAVLSPFGNTLTLLVPLSELGGDASTISYRFSAFRHDGTWLAGPWNGDVVPAVADGLQSLIP